MSAAATGLTGKAVFSSWLPMAVMMAYLAAESYPRFAFTRKKSDLVLAILTTIAAAAALAAYVVSVVRGV